MNRKPDRLGALAALAGLAADRALVPVAQAQARLATVRAQADMLGEARATLVTDAGDPLQAALMARQAEGLRQRQIAMMSDLARLQADLEIAKAAARPAYGRKIALERMLTQRRS